MVMSNKIYKHIVFFDEVCGLCNKGVDFLLKIDKNNNLFFSPLQGKEASKHLSKNERNELDSFVFYSNGRVFKRSRAIIEVFSVIGGLWSISNTFKIIPNFLRDYIYDIVAKSRYSIFGKKDTCKVPTKKERGKFLD